MWTRTLDALLLGVSADCGATWYTNYAYFSTIAGSDSGKHLIAIGTGPDEADDVIPFKVFVSETYGFTWNVSALHALPNHDFAAIASDAKFVHVMVMTCSRGYPSLDLYCISNATRDFQNYSAWLQIRLDPIGLQMSAGGLLGLLILGRRGQ